jgi:hypothetical protein
LNLQLVAPLAPNLPRFIRDAVERARLIYTHPDRFPEITGAAFTPGERIRKRRPSHLQACALYVAALMRRMDRRTLRVGDQRDDGLCNGVPLRELALHTGVSLSRLKRARATCSVYVNAVQPVVRLREPRARPGGGVQVYAGLPAIRTIRPLLLQRLGFSPAKIHRARRRGYADWCRRKGKPLSPVAIQRWHHDVTALTRANHEREQRLLRSAVVLADPHVKPPGSR